jgi:phosphatidylglycerol:prolipoprotein diacylglycerol transferase
MLFVSNIEPLVLSLGPISIRWYGLLFSFGFIIGYFLMQYMFKKLQYKTEDLDKLLVLVFFGTVIGARLGHCFFYEPDFYLSHPLEILKIWHGGLASHGGTVGVLITVFIFCRRYQYRLLEMLDMLSIPVSLVSTLIRCGNFTNSEILGIPTHGDYGVIFARLGETFPRHPAQLYEACAYLITFIVLSLIYFNFKKRPHGLIFGLLFILVFGSRILIEPFKMEQADYSTGTIFTVGQYLSVPFILAGLAVIIYAYHRQKKEH